MGLPDHFHSVSGVRTVWARRVRPAREAYRLAYLGHATNTITFSYLTSNY